jgi:drug/metabolite transporter (DMT)-like permease
MMTSHHAGIVCAVLSAMLSSLAWVFQGEAVKSLTPLVVASAQGLLTGLFYLAHLKITKTQLPWKTIRDNRRELFEYILLRGVIGSILVCYALVFSDSIKVMFLTKLEPYLILFWAWILHGTTISRAKGLLLLIHIGGAVLLSTGGTIALGDHYWGDALVVLAVALFGYCYLHAGRLSAELGAIHLNGVASLASGLIILPLALAFAPLSAWNPFTLGWANLIAVVILFDVIAITLWYHSMRTLEGWLVSALRAAGPVCAAPLAWAFFGQSLTQLQILGAGLVLGTSALLARSRRTS